MALNSRLNKFIDVLICLCAGSIFAWGVACGILGYIYYSPPYYKIFIYIILIMCTLRIIFYNKYTAAVVSAISAVALLLFLYNMRVNPELYETVWKALEFINKIIQYIGGYEQYTPEYEFAVTFMICGAVSLFTFVFSIPRFGFYALLGLAAASYGIILSAVKESSVYSLPFTACITGLLILLARYLCGGTGRFKTRVNPVSIWAMLIIILCVGTAQFLPVPEKGFIANTADTVIYKPFKFVNKYISQLFAPKYFTLSSAGYMRSDNTLGGDIMLTDDVVMEVTAKTTGRLYLAGAYKDKYTGYSWENTLTENLPYTYDDPNTALLERMFSNVLLSVAVGEIEPLVMLLEDSSQFPNTHYSNRSEYINGGTLTIQMQKVLYSLREIEINVINSKTFTVFTSGLTVGVEKNDYPVTLLKDGDDNISAARLMNKNSPYNLYYREDPKWAAGFDSIESLSKRGVYQEIYAELQRLHEKYKFDKKQISALLDETLSEDLTNLHMLKFYPSESPDSSDSLDSPESSDSSDSFGEDYFNPDISVVYEDFLKDVLIPRAEKIYERYTALPESLPKRVADLALELTEKESCDVDKALAINRFLRNNYPYTTIPGDIPEGRDFVDYFLFDLQKGYCTYFSTAFVVLCRAAGIPARYIEGYVTPPEKDENSGFIITNKQGHAWAEIYLEGYGWRKFDPTPASDSNGRPERLPAAESYQLTDENTGDVLTLASALFNADTENLNLNLNLNLTEPDGRESREYRLNQDNITALDLQPDKQNKHLINILLFNLIIAILLVLAAFIIYILSRCLADRRYINKINRKTNNEAAFEYYKIILKYLRFFNCQYEKSEYETVHQFTERLKKIKKMDVEAEDTSIISVPMPVSIESMKNVADIISKASYGRGQIHSDDVDMIKHIVKDLDNKLRYSAGRIKYFYYFYIKRIIRPYC